MKAFNVTTSSAVAVPSGYWDSIVIYNNSDSTVYLQIDGSPATLTISNGLPIAAATYFTYRNGEVSKKPFAVRVIHGAAGNKEIRIQGDE